MRLTRRILLLALAAIAVAAAAWPDGAERVARVALLAVGAALVADLVTSLRRALPAEDVSPFAPPRYAPPPPWRPKGLIDLQREIRLMEVGRSGRLPAANRLRRTARAAAAARLQTLGLDLDRAGDEDAARSVLGPAAYDFIVGHAASAPIEELLLAVERPRPARRQEGDAR